MSLQELAHLATESDFETGSFHWIAIIDPCASDLKAIAEIFQLNHFAVEDALNPHRLSTFDFQSDRGHALLKTLAYDRNSHEVNVGQISVFVERNFVMSVSLKSDVDLEVIASRVSSNVTFRSHGSLSVLYGLMDSVVDQYLAVATEVVEDMREVEKEVFTATPSLATTRMIYRLKKENIAVRSAIYPLVGPAQHFVSLTYESIPTELRHFFADLGEHVLRVEEMVNTTDNSLLTMLMASTALQDLKQNSDMRKISAWVAIAAVPTLTAGIYGMNFDNMPELHWTVGYPLVIAFMAITCIAIYRGFKKSGWL